MYTVVQQVHLNFLLVCLLSFRDPILLLVRMLNLLIKDFLSKLVVQGLTAVVYLCSVVLQGVVALQELVAPPPRWGWTFRGWLEARGSSVRPSWLFCYHWYAKCFWGWRECWDVCTYCPYVHCTYTQAYVKVGIDQVK